MGHMENKNQKVVGLDPVLNWSRKNCGPGSGPEMIHICTKTVVLLKSKLKHTM